MVHSSWPQPQKAVLTFCYSHHSNIFLHVKQDSHSSLLKAQYWLHVHFHRSSDHLRIMKKHGRNELLKVLWISDLAGDRFNRGQASSWPLWLPKVGGQCNNFTISWPWQISFSSAWDHLKWLQSHRAWTIVQKTSCCSLDWPGSKTKALWPLEDMLLYIRLFCWLLSFPRVDKYSHIPDNTPFSFCGKELLGFYVCSMRNVCFVCFF